MLDEPLSTAARCAPERRPGKLDDSGKKKHHQGLPVPWVMVFQQLGDEASELGIDVSVPVPSAHDAHERPREPGPSGPRGVPE